MLLCDTGVLLAAGNIKDQAQFYGRLRVPDVA